MPINYTIHPDLRLVVTRMDGRPTDEEFVGAYEAIMDDAAYVPGMNEVADLRGAEGLDVSVEALRQVETLTRRRYAGSEASFRTAIIAPRDQTYGIGRMYEVFAEDGPENVRVCRTVDAAAEWLGLDVEDLDGVL